MQRIVVILFSALLLAQSCTNEMSVPRKLLQPMQMKAVLLDMQAAMAYADMSFTPHTPRELKIKQSYKEILEIHHITKDQFLESYRYYEQHPGIMQVVYDSLAADVKRRKDVVDSIRMQRYRQPGDMIKRLLPFISNDAPAAYPPFIYARNPAKS